MPAATRPSEAIEEIKIAADCWPRMSPPSAWAASSAASRRSENVPSVPASASAIASGTVSFSIMFAWTDQPGPVRCPAWRDAPIAGVRSRAAGVVDHRDLARRLPGVVGHQRVKRGARGVAVAHPLEAERPVAQLREGLRRDRADAGLDPGNHCPGREEVRLHGNAEGARFRISCHHRIGHGVMLPFRPSGAQCPRDRSAP